MADAAAQFDRWDIAGGQVLAGLLRRRQAETTEFQS
jgi:lysozyme